MFTASKPATQFRRRSSERGGVMILALLITAAATVGFVAWGNLIVQRSQNVEQSMGGTQRRIAVENGRQLAREHAYRNLLTKPSGGDLVLKFSEANGQVIGGVEIPAWNGYAMESTFSGTLNKLSLGGGSRSSYGAPLHSGLNYSVTDYYPEASVEDEGTLAFELVPKSRSALLSGEALIIHPSSRPIAESTVTGSFDVQGMASFLTTSNLARFNTIRCWGFNTPAHIPNAGSLIDIKNPGPSGAGSVVLPSNFPSIFNTTGSQDGTSELDELSYMNVVAPAGNPSNSFKAKLETGILHGYQTFVTTADFSAGAFSYVASTGVLTVDLNVEVSKSLVLEDNIVEIKLIGASGAGVQGYSPLCICYVESGLVPAKKLTKITCSNGASNRLLVLGIKKKPAAVMDPPDAVTMAFESSSPTWRAMLLAENTPLSFSALGGGMITIQGGIETDSSLVSSSTVTGMGVKLISEPSTSSAQGLLRDVLPRRAWVETYLEFSTNGSF